MIRKLRSISAITTFAAVVALPFFSIAHALASEFSDQPIRLVVAFAAGGPADLLTRRLAVQLSKQLETPVIVDNKPGAGGAIATTFVVNAKPDGRTLLLNTGALATEVAVKNKIPYDVLKDLAPISKVALLPSVIMVNNAVPARNLKELITYSMSAPDALSVGSSGIGSSTHVAAELLKSVTGIQAVHIPYGGGAPMNQALLTGEINLLVAPISSSKPLATSGKVRPIAVTTAKRVPYWPEVPTAAEEGFPSMDFSIWQGFFAPAKTPAAILNKLSVAFQDATHDPDIKAWMLAQGYVPVGNKPAEFKIELAAEIKMWQLLAQKMKISKID